MEIKTDFSVDDMVWIIHNSYITRGIVKQVKIEHKVYYDEPCVSYLVKIIPEGSERDHIEVYEGYAFSEKEDFLKRDKLWVDYISNSFGKSDEKSSGN